MLVSRNQSSQSSISLRVRRLPVPPVTLGSFRPGPAWCTLGGGGLVGVLLHLQVEPWVGLSPRRAFRHIHRLSFCLSARAMHHLPARNVAIARGRRQEREGPRFCAVCAASSVMRRSASAAMLSGACSTSRSSAQRYDDTRRCRHSCTHCTISEFSCMRATASACLRCFFPGRRAISRAPSRSADGSIPTARTSHYSSLLPPTLGVICGALDDRRSRRVPAARVVLR